MNAINAMGGLPLMILCMAIVPGICEELLCRGALLSGFKKSLGSRYAILMSAFLFAVLHMSPYRFVPQFVLGIFLAVIVLRSHSIWLAMIVHAGHNGIVLVLQYVAENDPEIARMIQEQAGQTITTDHIYAFVGMFVISASAAAGICMLIKPPAEKELIADS